MVVFNCNACSSVLKRNQVESHCYKCRACESLSCVDCGKDFWGDDYQNHTKCITEEEKYGRKDNAPKVFKGEAKQEQWLEQVQSAIDKASSKPNLKWLLERLREYPNIPRKKAKFENFVKNSVRVNSTSLIAEVWDVLMTDRNKTTPENKDVTAEDNSKGKSDSSIGSNGDASEGKNGNNQLENESTESTAPKSKREKKEERRKNAHKKEKKDRAVEKAEDSSDVKQPKKNKKRKRQDSEEPEDISDGQKKKKGSNASEEVAEPDDGNDSTENIEEPPPAKRKKTRFDWDTVIISALEKKGEMSLKKLKKKVLSEFAAQDAANYNESNLSAKFDKKIVRTPGVKVSKDRASLKET